MVEHRFCKAVVVGPIPTAGCVRIVGITREISGFPRVPVVFASSPPRASTSTCRSATWNWPCCASPGPSRLSIRARPSRRSPSWRRRCAWRVASPASGWHLLADPNMLPAFQVAYLTGRRSPTIESSDAEFNPLGIQLRAYFAFGVAQSGIVIPHRRSWGKSILEALSGRQLKCSRHVPIPDMDSQTAPGPWHGRPAPYGGRLMRSMHAARPPEV